MLTINFLFILRKNVIVLSFNAHCRHKGTAIKHPVPDRVKLSFVISWHPGTLSVRVPGCQKLQMTWLKHELSLCLMLFGIQLHWGYCVSASVSRTSSIIDISRGWICSGRSSKCLLLTLISITFSTRHSLNSLTSSALYVHHIITSVVFSLLCYTVRTALEPVMFVWYDICEVNSKCEMNCCECCY